MLVGHLVEGQRTGEGPCPAESKTWPCAPPDQQPYLAPGLCQCSRLNLGVSNDWFTASQTPPGICEMPRSRSLQSPCRYELWGLCPPEIATTSLIRDVLQESSCQAAGGCA